MTDIADKIEAVAEAAEDEIEVANERAEAAIEAAEDAHEEAQEIADALALAALNSELGKRITATEERLGSCLASLEAATAQINHLSERLTAMETKSAEPVAVVVETETPVSSIPQAPAAEVIMAEPEAAIPASEEPTPSAPKRRVRAFR